jgi:3-deoxy-manno-octulosonate cytidylyltransferase (CMP-KDO synthetase)
MKTAIIIPSRLGSTRLPNKPLALIHGKTLIEHCYDSAIKANCGEVFVATDSEEIAQIITKIGGNAIMTPSDLPSGTDRIFHAYNQIIKDQIGKEFDFIVNLQGDVPNISPIIIQKTIQTIQKTGCDISTAVMKISKETAQIPSCVKAVLAGDGEFRKALYFSRQPVPHNSETFFEHVGLYVYTVESLKKFTSLPESTLEKAEKLEQLRAIENGMTIHACIVDSSLKPISIDTQEDLNRAINLMKKQSFASTERYERLAQSLKQNMGRRKV